MFSSVVVLFIDTKSSFSSFPLLKSKLLGVILISFSQTTKQIFRDYGFQKFPEPACSVISILQTCSNHLYLFSALLQCHLFGGQLGSTPCVQGLTFYCGLTLQILLVMRPQDLLNYLLSTIIFSYVFAVSAFLEPILTKEILPNVRYYLCLFKNYRISVF